MKARLELRFALETHETKLRIGAQDPPWRVIRAFQSSGSALVHLHNVSGGVLAGDQFALDVQVSPGAKAQLTTTGATRLYRHREGAADSEQITSITVAEDALLEFLPDPLIPFAHARHHQSTTIKLADGATYLAWDVIAPGRQAMGEKFRYDSLRIATHVESPQGPLLLEDFVLEPHVRSLQSLAVLGPYTHTASFYAFQIGRPAADLRVLESQLGEIARESSHAGCTMWGASALVSDGILVRGVSTTSRELPATLARLWTTARRFLTGEDAVPPRKLK